MAEKKRLLSGVKPTGKPHLGNYFGAFRQWVSMQDKFETFVMIADLHALTTVQDKNELKQLTENLVLDLLGVGVDPQKSVIFRQSKISAHTELAWIFSCITTMPYLMRAHAFKDAEAKNKEINAGVFLYPMLMATDILLYDSNVVPVGKDQAQHLEIARDTARKFNHTFGDVFQEPEAYIVNDVAVVPGIDGEKMSKSYNNVIPLFGTDEEIKKSVMGIITDSSGDVPHNVYAIHKLFKTEAELKSLYDEKKGKYKELKEALFNDILALVAPMRARREEYVDNPKKVAKILAEGEERASSIADKKMELVRELTGLV